MQDAVKVLCYNGIPSLKNSASNALHSLTYSVWSTQGLNYLFIIFSNQNHSRFDFSCTTDVEGTACDKPREEFEQF